MTTARESQQMYLYRFFDREGVLLYIGISNNPEHRWDAHAGDKPWWHEVKTQTCEPAGDIKYALAAEAAAIDREQPRYNVMHNLANPSRVVYRPEKRRRGHEPARRAGRFVLRMRPTLGFILWSALATALGVKAAQADFPYGWQFAGLAAVFALFCARPRSNRRRSRRRH